MTDLFLALVCSGLHERPLAAEQLQQARTATAASWASLLKAARKQTVPGQVYQALLLLPATIRPPEAIVTALMSDALRAVRRTYAVSAATEHLVDRLKTVGLSPVVMKGVSVAAFYKHPEFRASGDIDLYLPAGEINQAYDLLDDRKRLPDGSRTGRFEGVDVDLHDHYFDLHCAARKLPAIGTPEAKLLMLSSHILKHAIGPGVGLRQLCDMAMAVQALGSQCDPAALRELFRRTGTLRWNRLLFSFLSEHLSVSDPVFSDKEPVATDVLLRIVLEGGNFGHHAASRKAALGGSDRQRKRDTLRRFLHRLPFSLHYAPHETLVRMITLLRGNLHQ